MRGRSPLLLGALLAGALTLGTACSDSVVGVPLQPPARDGWSSDAAWPGFTLVAPLSNDEIHLVDMAGEPVHSWDVEGEPGVAIYLTARGTLLRCMHVDDHPVFHGGGSGGRVQEIDVDGTVLWELRWDGEQSLQHHDIEELPNGNILMIAWDRKTRDEALAVGRDPELLEGEELWPDALYEIRPTRPEGGEVVWSWHAWDHLVQDLDPEKPNYGKPADFPHRIDINGDRDGEEADPDELAAEQAQMAALGYVDGGPPPPPDGAGPPPPPGAGPPPDGAEDNDEERELTPEQEERKKRRESTRDADWMHSNAVAYNAELDQIAISVRRFDEIWVIDHSTTTEEAAGSTGGRSGRGGDLLYRWGNPYAYGMGEWSERKLIGQHNVQWIADGHLGAGNLIAFSNGGRRSDGDYSSVEEWWAPRDAAGNYLREEGQRFGPEESQWSYTAPERGAFYSSFISGAQRLPNGNTLICSGAQGWVFEVTPDGAMVWDWKSPFLADPERQEEGDRGLPRGALFRAERYAADHPGIVALRAQGAAIPLDPGTGPATNQRVDPEPEDEAEDGDAADAPASDTGD